MRDDSYVASLFGTVYLLGKPIPGVATDSQIAPQKSV
jgi:hypothetical protein